MPPRRVLLLACALLTSGCLWPVRENTDYTVADLATHTLDPQPAPVMPRAVGASHRPGKASVTAFPDADVQTTALMQAERRPKLELEIPSGVPGGETPQIELPKNKVERERVIRRLYPPLPPLPAPPQALPNPGGKPYTLSDLQHLALENNPALRQAIADVEAARGALIQARTYNNPVVGFEQDPSNNGSTAGVFGVFIDQIIRTAGKVKLAGAAAERDLRNAELALKRARSDLATAVRAAYYGLLVAEETVRVTLVLARFTDEVYRLQAETTVAGGLTTVYEPAPLRAQAYAIRLAYKQAVANYIYAWKQLVAAVGLRHAPLTQVAGHIDRFIPRYDFDAVLAHVLGNHTDVLSAHNGVEKARYSLKLAQVVPYPDVEVRFTVQKEIALPPFNWIHTLQVGGPLPVWDRNKGNIIAAQAALERALEQPHQAEVTLAGNLANTYANYKTNLDALVYYRAHVLPDLVRYYRGVYERRHVDPAVAFNDLVTAQQTLVSNVTIYLTTLGQFWTAVVNIASLLQTEDLFQLGKPEELPPFPDLNGLPRWTCAHGSAPAGLPGGSGVCAPAPGSGAAEVLPAVPQQPTVPGRLPLMPKAPSATVIPLEVRPVR